MLGLGLTTEQIVEILSAYSAADEEIMAVTATPGWNVVGGFTMPVTATVLLDVMGSVSDAALTMHARLYCVTPGHVGEVTGSTATIASTTDVRALSGEFELAGARAYQFQVEVTGGAGDNFFGVIRAATLTNG